ncbi:MAG TPA: PTS sugar transporter subunit IIA [Anaerolineaceae bacterium]|nr:PTS sugar transporter subunit IIA [Anaerolineaceae bacterium]
MTDVLTLKTVRLNGTARDKEDAIRQAGALLVEGGYVAPGYIEGMLQREQSMSTYVGNGVAIPHGQFDDLSLIYKTGICVLQLPEGVIWEDEEKVYLVVGIAATSDEHVNILANLAEVIEDEETAQLLARTDDPELVVSYLNRPPVES